MNTIVLSALKEKNPLLRFNKFLFSWLCPNLMKKTQWSLWIFFNIDLTFSSKMTLLIKEKRHSCFQTHCFLIFPSESVLTPGRKMVSMWDYVNEEHFLISCKTTFVKLLFKSPVAKDLKLGMIKAGAKIIVMKFNIITA